MDFVSPLADRLVSSVEANLDSLQWSRLLSPLSSGSSRKDQAKDPAKRLHRFEKEYGHLLSSWRASGNLTKDNDAAENLEIRLQELTNILSDESRRPLPHPCIQYASIKQIYVPIGKIATTSYNEWIIKEAVLFFATLIESEEEAFVENPTFSASLTNLLVRITGHNSVRLGLDTESRVVELAFNITTKIRLEPNILPAWFKSQRPGSSREEPDDRELDTFVGRTQRADFPLFYILMDYIHHEGKVGDFARTGLLYIIEAASNSAPLEQWIVESDLSTLMATGLGALYSQLSRKLVIDHLPHDLPPILAFSDYEHPTSNYEVISSCSPEFQSHLETFLSHLLFWQDVLNHCRSVDVKSTLLEHFQVIFLQQLLYPSLLESSDIDGGSSVAVLTYLRRILESLDHPDMINLILHYLLALPDHFPSAEGGPRSLVSMARKRKSMDLATMLAEKTEITASPLLFNLVDLILACLRSRNQQTIHVTLQLVSAILKRHHRYAIITLLRTDVVPLTDSRRTIGAHEQEVEYIMALAGNIGGHDNFDEVYQSVLQDTLSRLESHPCSVKLVAPKVSLTNPRGPPVPDSLPGAPREVMDHTLRADDPLLNALLDLLETFFINPVETNLSVTETLVDLAVCGHMKIEGWLSRNPASYAYEEEESKKSNNADENAESDDEDELEMPPTAEELQLAAMGRCRQRPQWAQTSLPRILNVLKYLQEQVSSYKKTIPRFDELVQQRREAFQTADAMLSSAAHTQKATPAQQETPDRRSLEETPRSGSPARPSALEGLAHRLLSELGTPSRANTPRGRKEQNRSGNATPSSKPGLAPPKEIYRERSTGSPGRSQSRSRADDGARARDEAVASQMAAFAAIDQTILSRRVGLPAPSVEPIPLNFDKKPMPEPTETEEDEHEAVEVSKESTEEATKETTEEATKETTEEATKETTEQATKETTEEATKETTEQATKETTEQATKETTEQATEETTEQATKETTEEASKEATEAVTEEAAEEAVEEATEEVTEETTEEATEEATEETTEEATKEAPEDSEGAADVAAKETTEDATEDATEASEEAAKDAVVEDDQDKSGDAEKQETKEENDKEEQEMVSVSHVVTNVIILQSFMFELASLVQVRAGLFDEIRFV